MLIILKEHFVRGSVTQTFSRSIIQNFAPLPQPLGGSHFVSPSILGRTRVINRSCSRTFSDLIVRPDRKLPARPLVERFCPTKRGRRHISDTTGSAMPRVWLPLPETFRSDLQRIVGERTKAACRKHGFDRRETSSDTKTSPRQPSSRMRTARGKKPASRDGSLTLYRSQFCRSGCAGRFAGKTFITRRPAQPALRHRFRWCFSCTFFMSVYGRCHMPEMVSDGWELSSTVWGELLNIGKQAFRIGSKVDQFHINNHCTEDFSVSRPIRFSPPSNHAKGSLFV